MRNGAYVEILGRLGSDVQLRSTKEGKPYGVLSIVVNKKVKATSEDNKLKNIAKWYKAIIWNKHLLIKMEPLLKTGKKILLIGELDVIQPTEPGKNSYTVILVKSKSGIEILADYPLPEVEVEVSDEEEEVLPEELTL